ncbi:MAG: hypothetical protein NC223_08285 [Butyrivibrio sp.]|nr:hypothetical protein [Butyrivibrio sp.]
MRKNIQKGERGYLRSRKIRLGIGSLCGFLLMVLIYLTGYLIYGTVKNYVTILAVLVILPTAKIFVQYLLLPWKCRAPEEEYKELAALCLPLKLYCELLITAQEKSFEIMYLLIGGDESIIAYTANPKSESGRFEKGVTNFLNYYEFDSKVKLFTDLGQFKKRAKQLAARSAELTDEQREHISTVFEKISIMSV